MKATEEALRQRVRQSWERDDVEEVPPFDMVWRHAEAKLAASNAAPGSSWSASRTASMKPTPSCVN